MTRWHLYADIENLEQTENTRNRERLRPNFPQKIGRKCRPI